MKQFQIDDITISLEDELVKELIEHYVLDDETTDPEDWEKNNYWYLKHIIRASFTHSLEEVGKVTLKDIRRKYTDEEISKKILKLVLYDLEIRGGSYKTYI